MAEMSATCSVARLGKVGNWWSKCRTTLIKEGTICCFDKKFCL